MQQSFKMQKDAFNVSNFLNNSEICPLQLEVLDFLHNFTQLLLAEPDVIWPCEVRYYWITLKPFVQFVRFLLAYVTPFIIILGVSLNIISFVMLNTKMLFDSTLSMYLKALSLSDNGALIFAYAVSVARRHSLEVNELFRSSSILCGMSSVTMELFQFTSTWLVVSLTWARVTAVLFPFATRYQNYCHDKSAIFNIITLTIISFTVALTKLYSGGYESDSVFEFVPCQKKITPWGSAMYFYIALSTWLPLLFIFLGNVVLIIHMRKTDKIRKQLTSGSARKRLLKSRTSRTLFTVSIVHLVLLLPLGVVETLELYWDVILIKSPTKDNHQDYISWLEEKMLLKWCRGLLFHIYHWNFAINFFLYCLTGEKFRNTVFERVSRLKRVFRKGSSDTSTTKSTKCSKVQTPNVFLIRLTAAPSNVRNSSVENTKNHINSNNSNNLHTFCGITNTHCFENT